MNLNEKSFKIVLISILTSAFLMRLAFVFFIPDWQAPDEYPHFHYIKHVALTNSLPLSSPKFPHYEAFQPPLYYLVGALIYKAFSRLDDTSYPEDVSVIKRNRNSMLVLLRIFSVILGTLTIFLTYKVAESIFSRADVFLQSGVLILAVTAFVAYLPTFVSNTTSVTNDNLANLLGAIILYLGLRMEDSRNPLMLGTFLGLGTLTKHSLLVFYPFIFILMFLKRISPLAILKRFSLIVIIALTLSGWYFWRNYVIYGNVLALNPGVRNSLSAITVDNFVRIVRNFNWSFWCAFGRIYEIHLEPVHYLVLFVPLTVISLYGISKFLYVSRDSNHRDRCLSLYVKHLFCGAILIAFAALIYSFSYQQNCAWGKYLFPMLPAFAILFSLGLHQSFGHKAGKILLVALILIFVAIDFVILNRFLSLEGT